MKISKFYYVSLLLNPIFKKERQGQKKENKLQCI